MSTQLFKTTTAERTRKAFRQGDHATVYELRRDPTLNNRDRIKDKKDVVFPFISGARYKGEWIEDQKDGFGTLESPDGTKYEGEWKNNKQQGVGTLWVTINKKLYKRYVGSWADGMMDGFGLFYNENGDVYRGNWSQNQRSGTGKLEYHNGDHYEGSWKNDLQNGFGTHSYVNGNIYEGEWLDGKKNGAGKYFYASTVKVYTGEWVADQPRCGEYAAPSEEDIALMKSVDIQPLNFELPLLGVEDPKSILDAAVTEVREARLAQRMMASAEACEEAWES